MRKISRAILSLAMVLILAPGCHTAEDRVVLGDERLEAYLPMLKGKRVAILSNQSGIVGDVVDGRPCRREVNPESIDEPFLPFGSERLGPHLLDVLLDKGIDVVAVFSPEHGFRGQNPHGLSDPT